MIVISKNIIYIYKSGDGNLEDISSINDNYSFLFYLFNFYD